MWYRLASFQTGVALAGAYRELVRELLGARLGEHARGGAQVVRKRVAYVVVVTERVLQRELERCQCRRRRSMMMKRLSRPPHRRVHARRLLRQELVLRLRPPRPTRVAVSTAGGQYRIGK
jgi:hypothetical protein